MRAVRKTRSVCPVCLKNIEARLVEREGVTYIEKACPEHGEFSVPVWHGLTDMGAWRAAQPPMNDGEGTCCPDNCGGCAEHASGTCCALLEVTKRCNLNCRFCFANGGETDSEPPLSELKTAVSRIMELGNRPLLQLSGGEPTLRDDLPELIRCARDIGFKYIQLNSNGIRLAEDEAYVKALAEAGLSFVFMQFDGVSDGVYEALRGRPLLSTKLAAIDACGKAGLGVTLVPTVVRGVNDAQLGDIIKLGVSLSPTVRGVHFQPVSYFGRFPGTGDDRYTLDELIHGVCGQFGIDEKHLLPSRCDHPMCGFHAGFIVLCGKTLLPLARYAERESGRSTAEQNREYIARRWLRAAEPKCCGGDSEPEAESCCGDAPGFDKFLSDVKQNSFTLTAMAFQDAMNLDIERLRLCSLHVYDGGVLKPFCARYLTSFEALK